MLRGFEEEKMIMSPKSARKDSQALTAFMDIYKTKRESSDRNRQRSYVSGISIGEYGEKGDVLEDPYQIRITEQRGRQSNEEFEPAGITSSINSRQKTP